MSHAAPRQAVLVGLVRDFFWCVERHANCTRHGHADRATSSKERRKSEASWHDCTAAPQTGAEFSSRTEFDPLAPPKNQ
eukprot:5441838-Pleurochrysis_carterae.AAC.1